jgi:hypothetical protein
MLPLEENSAGEYTSQPALEILEGIKFAVDEYNKLRSDKIGLLVRDTKKDANEIKKIREEFSSLNSVISIIGPIFSNEVRIALQEFEDYDIPIISPTATDDDLTNISQNFFQANPSFSVRGKVMAQYVYYVENRRTVSVLNSIEGYSPVLAASFINEFEKLGGKNWDQRRADIYTREQKSFGVGRTDGRLDPVSIGHAMLGLAYQPGRYVNPGPQEGQGMPTGAVGAAGLLAAMLWLISGKSRRYELSLVGWVGLSLAMWFVLSQQSRYLVFLLPPLCLLAGTAVARLASGKILAAACVLQALHSLWMVNTDVVSDKVRVALGADTPQAYLESRLGFYKAAQRLNELAKGGKVALYDEVFGFYLDVPYFWANPGHSTLIPYDSMKDGNDFADEMRKLGYTHVSFNLRAAFPSVEERRKWLGASGLTGEAAPYSEQEMQALAGNWEVKYKYLVADACAKGRLGLAADPRDTGGTLVLGILP